MLKGKFRKAVALFLLLTLAVSPALAAGKVKNFEWVPGDHSVSFSFTAEGYNTVEVCYTNSLEKGSVTVVGTDGRFEGVLSVPATYPGNIVAVTVKSDKGRLIMEKVQTKTAPMDIPAIEKSETGRLVGVTVCIDPGHQGVKIGKREPMGPGLSGFHNTDNGQAQGVATRRYENVVVLEIGQKLRNALLAEGADVIMTRNDANTPVTNVERAEIANNGGADLFIRLHCDSSTVKTKRGIHVYVPLSSDYAKQVADKVTHFQYGEAILNAMFASTGVTKGSVKQGNGYVANNWAKMPSFLVEMGYMSNAEEDKLLSDPDYQDLLIEGMVNGLVEVARLRHLID